MVQKVLRLHFATRRKAVVAAPKVPQAARGISKNHRAVKFRKSPRGEILGRAALLLNWKRCRRRQGVFLKFATRRNLENWASLQQASRKTPARA